MPPEFRTEDTREFHNAPSKELFKVALLLCDIWDTHRGRYEMPQGYRPGQSFETSLTITVGVATSAPDAMAIADATCRNTPVTCGPTLIAFNLPDSTQDEQA